MTGPQPSSHDERHNGYSYHRVNFHGTLPPAPSYAADKMSNWPAVYVIDNANQVYIGETTNVVRRREQHQKSEEKRPLTTMRIVLHDEFNKSAALDLESYLIQLIGGDEGRQSLNGNAGLRDHDYYDRQRYQDLFAEIFERLREDRVFSQSRDSIINSTLYKLSPFKALTTDQERSLAAIVEAILGTEDPGAVGPFVVQGGPGTGKTVLGVFLMKLLSDLARLTDDVEESDLTSDEVFTTLFTTENHARLLANRVNEERFTIGIVVPQQSLRESLERVFAHTPGLDKCMVLDPWDIGADAEKKYDILVVDEAHRLNQRASQASGIRNAQFPEINRALFGEDDLSHTQLDWIVDRSVHQILLLDPLQTVRPSDLDADTVAAVVDRATTEHRLHPLVSQLRVKASNEYISFFSELLRGHSPTAPDLGEYDLRMFNDFQQMYDEIKRFDGEYGLSRLAAGYAWPWHSRRKPGDPRRQDWDICIEGAKLPWNRRITDWIASPGSLHEVGSIHTLQGYDLNYAGIVIGKDLIWNESTQRVEFNRKNYFDERGKQNNNKRGLKYTDEDLREYVINIYNVLLTRGVRGTYLYVVDPGLREQFARWFPGLGVDGATSAPFGIAPGRHPDGIGPVDVAVADHLVVADQTVEAETPSGHGSHATENAGSNEENGH